MKSFLKIYFLLILSANIALAQKIELGAGLGFMHYKGDISPNFHPSFARPGGNIFLRYNLSRAVSFKANALYGNIFADDAKVNDPYQVARGMSFKTNVLEGAAQIEYNFLSYQYNIRRHHNWSPYVFGGLAYASFSANNSQTGGLKNSGLTLPFGVGVKVQFREHWNWGIEFGTRRTFTDYLDNWGENNSVATNKFQQADPTRKDMYYYTSFTVSYLFFKVVCPEGR